MAINNFGGNTNTPDKNGKYRVNSVPAVEQPFTIKSSVPDQHIYLEADGGEILPSPQAKGPPKQNAATTSSKAAVSSDGHSSPPPPSQSSAQSPHPTYNPNPSTKTNKPHTPSAKWASPDSTKKPEKTSQ